jgi:chromate reductase, NAD(P)H dehydrogenase (quinone)
VRIYVGYQMASPIDIVAIAGSLRAASYNKGLLRAAAELAPPDTRVDIYDLASLPLYNQDLEKTGLPEPASNLRDRVDRADALLIATPEYNHTIPGVMGNAIDWLSRRLPTSPLRDKGVAIMGAARGGGSVRAQAALRVPLTHARALILDGPVVALYNVDQLASDAGDLFDPAARESVGQLVNALAAVARKSQS